MPQLTKPTTYKISLYNHGSCIYHVHISTLTVCQVYLFLAVFTTQQSISIFQLPLKVNLHHVHCHPRTPDGVEVLAEVVDVSSTSMGQGMIT